MITMIILIEVERNKSMRKCKTYLIFAIFGKGRAQKTAFFIEREGSGIPNFFVTFW